MYNTLQKIWVPATVIHVLPWNSYQVCTSNGSTYHCMWRHLHEHSVKAVNTVPSGTTATLQVPTQQCFLAVQHAPPPPAQHMQPTPAAPATLATQMAKSQLSLPCQLFKRMPWHQCLWHPMPHLCSHKDLAMPAWHLDTWSMKSDNFWPGLSTDIVFIMHHHPHPQSFVELNRHVLYSQKGGCCMIMFSFKNCSPLHQ